MEDITGRFIEFYDYLYRSDLVKSDAQLAKIIDVTPSAISNILSGASKAQLKIVYGIAKGFTTVNIDWLLTGRGEMLKNKTPSRQESNEGVPEIKKGSEPVSSDLFVRGLALMLRELYVIQETQVWLAAHVHGIEMSELVDMQDKIRAVHKETEKAGGIKIDLSM